MPMDGYPIEPLHAAHLAQLEGALWCLLRSAGQGDDPRDQPDAIEVRLTPEGMDLTYLRGALPIGGEGL